MVDIVSHNARILQDLQAQTANADMIVELARLRAENARLKANVRKDIKVSEKGAISVYGHGRMPTTLYASQWVKVLDKKEDILAFIEENKAALAFKPVKE